MKEFHRTWLVEEIKYNKVIYALDATLSGEMSSGVHTEARIKDIVQKQGNKCIIVNVLSRNLRGKTDNHGKLYTPTRWVYTNKK